jgi:hypothetical protein
MAKTAEAESDEQELRTEWACLGNLIADYGGQ